MSLLNKDVVTKVENGMLPWLRYVEIKSLYEEVCKMVNKSLFCERE